MPSRMLLGAPRVRDTVASVVPPAPPALPATKTPIMGLMPRNATSASAPAARFADGTCTGVVVNIQWEDVQLTAGTPAGNAAIDLTLCAEWMYYLNTLTPAACGGTRPPCRIRIFTAAFAPLWAKSLDAGSPITVYDNSSGSHTCPLWWKPNYLAAVDRFITKLATSIDTISSDGKVDGVSYAGQGFEAMPFIRDIAVAPATAITFAEPCQRGTLYLRGGDNIAAYIAAGLNDGTANAPNSLDAAAVLRMTMSRWTSTYGFATTPLYFPWNPFQQWDGSGNVQRDPGSWTEVTAIPQMSGELLTLCTQGNNSIHVPLISIGQPYITTYQVIAAQSQLGVKMRNIFQTQTLSGMATDFAAAVLKPSYAVYTVPADHSEYQALRTSLQVFFGEITPTNQMDSGAAASLGFQTANYYSCIGSELTTLPMRAIAVELPSGWKNAQHQDGSTTGLSAAEGAHFAALGAANEAAR